MKKIACVGDSNTYGLLVFNRKENSYPSNLQKLIGTNYLVKNFGVSGTYVTNKEKTYELTKKYKESLEFKPDIVIIMLGTNDTKDDVFINENIFKNRYLELLNTYNNLKQQPQIYLLTIPDQLARHYKLNKQNINIINNTIKDISKTYNTKLIDIYKYTENNYKLYAIDKIHLNNKGSYQVAKLVFENLDL